MQRHAAHLGATPFAPGCGMICDMSQDDWYSPAREVRVVFRTSKARKTELERRAREAGVSLQVYVEATVLRLDFEDVQAPGRQKKTAETLPGLAGGGAPLRPTG